MIFKKFLKGFITGGLAGLTAALSLGVSAHSLEDIKGVLITLAVAFGSGAIHGLVEAINPTVTVQPIQ